jgi:protein kinase A
VDREQTDHTNLEREILHNHGCTHPFIVELKAALQTQSHLYLVMELVSGGSLFDLISKADKPLSENAARFYAAELVLALEELHKNNIAYRDMKLENILIDQQGTTCSIIVLV